MTFLISDAFWLLFFHIKFHIPGNQPAFLSSVYQVQELGLFSPVGKFFLPLFQKNFYKQPEFHFVWNLHFQSNFTTNLCIAVLNQTVV